MLLTKLFASFYHIWCKKQFCSCGSNLRFHPKDSTFAYSHVSIGNNVFINRRAYFSAPNGKIIVGNDVLIGADVFLSAGHHNYNIVGKTVNQQGYTEENQRIVIENDVWIASKVTILGNVTIHKGAVIATGSLVRQDIPPYCLCAGSPRCIPIRFRYTDAELKEHFRILGSTIGEAEQIINLRREMTKDLGLA